MTVGFAKSEKTEDKHTAAKNSTNAPVTKIFLAQMSVQNPDLKKAITTAEWFHQCFKRLDKSLSDRISGLWE